MFTTLHILSIPRKDFLAFEGPTRRPGLIINERKTKYMAKGQEARKEEHVQIGVYYYFYVSVWLLCHTLVAANITYLDFAPR